MTKAFYDVEVTHDGIVYSVEFEASITYYQAARQAILRADPEDSYPPECAYMEYDVDCACYYDDETESFISAPFLNDVIAEQLADHIIAKLECELD